MVAAISLNLQTIRTQFQANSYTTGNQLFPDALGLSNGGYVVAYNNEDSTNGYTLLDFYAADGTSLGISVPFIGDGVGFDGSTDAIGTPSMAELDVSGDVVVVWADASPTGPGIRATIFNQNGFRLLREFDITTNSTDRAPQVTALSGGGFIAAYETLGGSIFATMFDNAGNVTKNEFVINTTTAEETDLAIVGLAKGGFVATWTYDHAGTLEVRARLFNSDGTPRSVNGSPGDFVVGAIGNNSQPAVAALPNGN